MRHLPFLWGPQGGGAWTHLWVLEDTKVYYNGVIRGYFVDHVLGIIVKLSVETIAQATDCERRGTKFIKLEDQIGNSLWGPNWPTCQGNMAPCWARQRFFERFPTKLSSTNKGQRTSSPMPESSFYTILWRALPLTCPIFSSSEVMKDKSIGKDIYHNLVLIKVFEAHGVIKKF